MDYGGPTLCPAFGQQIQGEGVSRGYLKLIPDLGRRKIRNDRLLKKLGLGSLRNVPYTARSRLAVSCRQFLE